MEELKPYRKKKYPRIGSAILLLILTTGLMEVLLYCTARFAPEFYKENPFLVPLLVYIMVFPLVLNIGNRKTNQPAKTVYPMAKISIPLFIFILITSAGLAIVALRINLWLSDLMPKIEYINVLGGLKNKLEHLILSLVVYCLAAPFFEELLFRGLIMGGFLQNYNHRKAIVASAILFSLSHPISLQYPTLFIIGLFFGWLFLRTGNLTACIWSHAFFNLFAVIGLNSHQFAEWCRDAARTKPWFIGLGLVLSIIGILMIHHLKAVGTTLHQLGKKVKPTRTRGGGAVASLLKRYQKAVLIIIVAIFTGLLGYFMLTKDQRKLESQIQTFKKSGDISIQEKLVKQGEKSSESLLVEYNKSLRKGSSSNRLRKKIVHTLYQIHGPEVLDLLYENILTMKEPKNLPYACAISDLAFIKSDKTVDLLIEILDKIRKDEFHIKLDNLVKFVASALKKVNSPRSIQKVIELFEDRSLTCRANIGQVLFNSQISRAELTTLLQKGIEDSETKDVLYFITLLKRIGTEQAYDVIAALTEKTEWVVWQKVVLILIKEGGAYYRGKGLRAYLERFRKGESKDTLRLIQFVWIIRHQPIPLTVKDEIRELFKPHLTSSSPVIRDNARKTIGYLK